MWDKVQDVRVLRPFQINLPHDVLAREAELHPDEWDPTKHDHADFPSTLQMHPVFLDKGASKTVPLGYYSDGVPYSKKDSFLTHYLSNHLSGKRHLLCTLKKTDMCKCGCAGFCTWGAVLRVLVWSMNVMALGKHPQNDHLGEPFGDHRFDYRGFDLAPSGVAGAVCEFRADLLELTTTLGLTKWSNPTNPCTCCTATKDQ
eukprot:2040297-Pyramimonas_sp.AAC.1